MAGGKFLWLGMTDTEDEGVFRWLNGAPLTYSVWGGREPNGRTFENYGGLSTKSKKIADLGNHRHEIAFCSTTG